MWWEAQAALPRTEVPQDRIRSKNPQGPSLSQGCLDRALIKVSQALMYTEVQRSLGWLTASSEAWVARNGCDTDCAGCSLDSPQADWPTEAFIRTS